MTAIFLHIEIRRYRKRLKRIHASLGIGEIQVQKWALPPQLEAHHLVSIGPDIYQRDQLMIPEAAAAWQQMVQSAAGSGVVLQAVSAFRSVDYQASIIRRKIEKGQSFDEIFRVSAAPGYSEHHTGKAIDVSTPGFAVLEEEFENSEAFSWLTKNAGQFGFRLSFPRENPHGVAYEPWHWAWENPDRVGQ